ncbi:L-2-hydroxyglutarate, partial [Hyphodiscus hymeniophilus]
AQVIGGGAVGLAIARQWFKHAAGRKKWSGGNGDQFAEFRGLYYGADSLKTKLCIRGREMLYDLCQKHDIPHRNMGKWIVAQTDEQLEELVKVNNFTRSIEGVPTRFVSTEEAVKEEPYVRAKTGILESSTTGIIDSHSYMQFLLGDLEDRGGDVALHSPVVRIAPVRGEGSGGWEITTRDKSSGEDNTFTSEVVINSAGLGACNINNMILPPDRHQTQYYAKGNYFSYPPSTPSTKHLIYPAPEPGLGGLGTHLTLDISGRIRFGPDVEWVDSPDDLEVNDARLPQAIEQIKKFLPDIKEDAIQPDYAGIRPKLGKNAAVATGKAFQDFVIRNEKGYLGFVNLLGIESPGLTSSLAIAEMVETLLYR